MSRLDELRQKVKDSPKQSPQKYSNYRAPKKGEQPEITERMKELIRENRDKIDPKNT